jgi:hypothetical protein
MEIKEILNLINSMEVSYRKAIKAGIKIPVAKKSITPKNNYKGEIAALFSIAKENKIRPAIGNVLVTENAIISTDLECTLIIPNNHKITPGVYNKLMFETGQFNDVFSEQVEYFPEIRVNGEGQSSIYDRAELLSKLEKVIFAAAKSQDNLSINCVRFNKNYIAASDSYRLITKELTSEIEFSLPLNSTKILIKILKLSNSDTIKVVLDNNQVDIFVGDYVFKSRIIDLVFPDVDFILDRLYSYKVTLKSEDIKSLFQNLAKVNSSFILDFKSKKVKVSSEKNNFESDINIEGEVGFNKISLNSKFILEYIKVHNVQELTIELTSNHEAVMINGEYLVMPLAIRDED